MQKLYRLRRMLFFIAVCSLFLWGIMLRSVELWNGNYLFGHDHGRDYLAAYSIVEDHKLTLIGAEVGSGVAGINGIFHGPGYFYLISLAYILFHGDPMGAQVFMAVFGVAAMVLAAWVGYRMMGRLGSVIFLFFIAVSPLIVSQSRFIWSSHPITAFILVALYFAFRIPDNPRLFAPLAVFAAGITYHSQLGVAAPLTLTMLLSLPLIYHISDWKTYLYSFFALILAYLPMIAFEARHGFMGAQPILLYVKGVGTTGASMLDPIKLSSHMVNYLDNFTNTFTFEFGWIPRNVQMSVLWTTLPVVLFGCLLPRPRKHKLFLSLVVLMILVTWFSYIFLNNVVWDYYLTHARIGFIFIYTFAIVSLFRSIRTSFLVKASLIILGVFIAVMACGSAFRQYISYSVDIHDVGVYEKIQGKRYVINEIYKDAGGQPFSIFVFMPSVYTHPYDYLFKTYGKQRYGYEPLRKKSGLAYLVIEPDLSEPWRHNGWLETVVNGGETVWKKTLLNGLILEKRIYPL